MAELTGIVWAGSTFDPLIGFTKVSEECRGCDAEQNFASKMHAVKWGDLEETR